jgi:hypothetical protein
MPAPTSTLALISQLAVGATWDHLDDEAASPVAAACDVLGTTVDPLRRAELERVVAATPDLDWTERVALALHLLLVDEPAGHLAQAA